MKTIKDVIVQLKTLSAKQLLDLSSNFSERGFLYEALWDIVVKFNCLPDISISKHIKSNLNKKNKICLTDFIEDFLDKPFRSGNSSGYSDITFRDKYGTLYVSSVKFFESETDKNRDDWDLHKLVSLQTIHGSAKNLVFTKNKQTFLSIYNNSNKNDIYTIERVFDISDLEYCLKSVVKVLEIYEWNFDKLIENYFGKQKTFLKLLFHQKLCLLKTSRMDKRESVLWGLKCRSGKSYIMAGHIIENKFPNVLIITPIPNESIHALVNMFNSFMEFDDYDVIHFQKNTNLKNYTRKNRIIIASKQFLDGKNIDQLNNINFDIIYSDENHWGGTTENSKSVIQKYKKDKTEFITLTATYSKTQSEWKIPDNQCFFWDLEDEHLCKTEDLVSLEKKHGSIVNEIVANHTIKDEYLEMPRLNILTPMFDPKFVSDFKEYCEDDSYGFDVQELLKCDTTGFVHKPKVNSLLDLYFGNNFNSSRNFMNRISKYDSRTKTDFHTQLWFLPYGVGSNLNETALSMKKLIEEHKFASRYSVEILTTQQDNSGKEKLYDYITSLEDSSKEEGKRGLILLLGFKCSMGISLPKADVVFLLNNGESMDMYMQMMMRSMTEDKSNNKKCGFVIDFNQKRVLHTTMNVVRGGNSSSIRSNIERATNIIDIDDDMIVKDKSEIQEKISKIWREAKINCLDLVKSRLEKIASVEIDKEDYKKISHFMKYVSSIDKSKKELKLHEDDEKLSDVESTYSREDSVSSDKLEKEKEEVKIDYGKELLTSIPVFVGLLTFEQRDITDTIHCLEYVEKDKILKTIFMQQCEIWWGVKNPDGFIDLLIYLIKKYYLPVRSAINSSIEIMKEKITILLDTKKELLDMINTMLKPKDVEKRKHGEVFTPLIWVEKMLDLLPKEVWSDETLKWYDPANGIGNFPVCVYYRLMEGLKLKIKNEHRRKEHILKNMLFMSELNAKNVFIAKTIFGTDCNLYEGDSLTFDFHTHWNIQKDKVIVIGNPPYNKELTRSGASPFYNEFIEKFIDNCKYLLFIVPSRWFSGGKGLDKFREMMLARKDIQEIVHFDKSKIVFGNSVDVEGGVNYFLKNKDYTGLCKFNGNFTDLSNSDILIDSKFQSIINKVVKYDSITELYQGRCFGIETNDKRLTNDTSFIKCYVSKQKGFEKYIDHAHIEKDYNFWKVITARANGKKKCFGNIFVGTNTEVHNGSYISFKIKSKDEAESLCSYMKCKFPNMLLGLRKASQDINESTCKWIPLPPLDRVWNDRDVYKYFNLTDDEIALIEN